MRACTPARTHWYTPAYLQTYAPAHTRTRARAHARAQLHTRTHALLGALTRVPLASNRIVTSLLLYSLHCLPQLPTLPSCSLRIALARTTPPSALVDSTRFSPYFTSLYLFRSDFWPSLLCPPLVFLLLHFLFHSRSIPLRSGGTMRMTREREKRGRGQNVQREGGRQVQLGRKRESKR
eukprot:3700487-Pleurochrysis_carterae.AAC.1